MVNAVTDKYEKTLFAYWILNNENTIITMKNILVTGGQGTGTCPNLKNQRFAYLFPHSVLSWEGL